MNNSLIVIPALFGVVVATCLATLGHAAEPASVVLLNSPEAVVTRGDWEADLERIPADKRETFASSPQRVSAVLNSLLVSKTLAARARGEGLDRDPRVAARIAIETDRLLAAQMIQKIESDAGAEFDRNPERNAARARELYLVGGSAKYSTPEEVDALAHPDSDRPARQGRSAQAGGGDAGEARGGRGLFGAGAGGVGGQGGQDQWRPPVVDEARA